MTIRRHAIQVFTYAAAILGGLALVLSFARFNALHDEFLGANFDSVHGARTLLKAEFFLELAAKDLENAGGNSARRPALLAQAAENLALAGSYSAEGHDKDPEVRAALSARIQHLRTQLLQHQTSPAAADGVAEYAPVLAEIHQLAKDFGNAELDRWGTLSSANAALAERMTQLRRFILASIVIFLLIMAALGWSLARTRRTEADLLRAKAEIEAIQKSTLDASPLGIAYTDATDPEHRRIKVANRQMALIFGYPPEQLLGVETAQLHADRAGYERLSTTLDRRLAAGEVVREEALMQRRNGEPFWGSLSIKAIDPSALGRGVVWTCEDICERKAAQAKLELAMEKAEAASQAKSEFVANMSHELRTPFAGILGLLDLLQRSPLNDDQLRHIKLARDSAAQMLSIVNDILDFSKIEAGKLSLDPMAFELRHLFSTIAEAHAAAAESKGLALGIEFVEPLPDYLRGDPVRIRQIVDNLINNALKFTPQGEVRLLVDGTPKDEAMFTLRVTVSDTGIGIPAEMHERIFHKFTQADSSTTRMFGGTGLGLAICQELATLIGGRITLTSRSGAGSRFCLELELPVAQALAPSHGQAAADVRGAVVLLVDDNATNRSVFAELLAHYGCMVAVAANGEQAIRLAGEIKPEVILMDCQMPVIDGRQATQRIRAAEATGEHVPIIALTAHATRCDRDSCLAAGMDDYLPKPVVTDTLIRKIAYWTCRRHQAADAPLPLPEPAPALTPLCGRVLLVEDNLAIKEATRCLIERTGCAVVVAEHGQAALEIFDASADAGDFDLVLMDCRMPVMDGLEATRRWRRRESERGLSPTAIIALTASDTPEVRQSCRDAGMNDILVKPFTEASLLALLNDWLDDKLLGDAEAQA